MAEDNDASRKILAEAKTFQFFHHHQGFILKELFKQGEREIFLTAHQSRWIVKGLKARNKSFGDNKRRECKFLEGSEVILIEGSNQKGIFLSIHVKLSGKENQFVVIPGGGKGRHWFRVANLIESVLRTDTHKFGDGSYGTKESHHQGKSTGNFKSFADALRGSIIEDGREESWNRLFNRLDFLEKEVVSLRSQVETLSSPQRKFAEVSNLDDFPVAAAAAMASISPVMAVSTAIEIPAEVDLDAGVSTMEDSIMGKTMGDPSDVISDPTVRISSTELPCLVSLCSRFFQEFSALSTNSHICSATVVAKKGVPAHSCCDKDASNGSDVSSGDDSSPASGNHAKGYSIEDSSQEDSSCVRNDARTRRGMICEDSFNNVPHGDEDEVSSNDSSSNISIYWDDGKEIYVHSSGMMHDPLRNTYFLKVGTDPNDLRSFYFVPKDGELKFALEGKLGAINKQTSQEEGWDLSSTLSQWYSTFPPNLLKNFMEKLHKGPNVQ